MKNKKYFTVAKILLYGILIINLILIFLSVNRSSTAVLIFSQLTFILFICAAWFLIKTTFSDFYKPVCHDGSDDEPGNYPKF